MSSGLHTPPLQRTTAKFVSWGEGVGGYGGWGGIGGGAWGSGAIGAFWAKASSFFHSFWISFSAIAKSFLSFTPITSVSAICIGLTFTPFLNAKLNISVK